MMGGVGLLINQPDGTETPRMSETIIPGVKKLIECLNRESSTGTPGYQLLILINAAHRTL